MSLQRVVSLASELPPALRDQVVGYAESVERVMPEAFAELGRPIDKERADKVVFWSGVRKIYSLVTATFWTLENSIEILGRSDIGRIRIGGSDFSRGSPVYSRMRELFDALEEAASDGSFREMMEESPRDSLRRTYQE